jgi:hypothetical protein
MVRCDKPTGKKAELKFLYPELGAIDPKADKAARLKELADIITCPKDGRLTRTIANRYWQKFMGRGLVEPVDDMEKTAWNTNLLDWLAADLADHHYDLKHLIGQILTSRAYQMPAVSFDEKNSQDYVFTGPLVRRMSAEQFRDALGELTGVWYDQPAGQIDYTLGRNPTAVTAAASAKWIWNVPNAATAAKPGTVYFRKTFKLDKVPSLALAFVAADNSFTFYVNGKKAGAGKDYSHLNVIDIKKELVKGENTFAVAAVNDGDQPNPAGLFIYAYLRRKETGQPAKILDTGTDASWSWSTAKAKNWEKPGFAAANWKSASVLGDVSLAPWGMEPQFKAALIGPQNYGKVRAVLANADVLQVALGRPNREQTVTTRISAATTLEALELTNGRELTDLIRRGAQNALAGHAGSSKDLIAALYARALGRKPTADELKLAREAVGQPAKPAGVEDLLWALTMLPEFQLIY